MADVRHREVWRQVKRSQPGEQANADEEKSSVIFFAVAVQRAHSCRMRLATR